MNGGRKKWISEGRDLDTAKTQPSAGYRLPGLRTRISLCARSCRKCRTALQGRQAVMIDVRSPQEFSGEILAPPGLPETCQRGGHIPGAHSVPWGKACNDDGTFKTYDELQALYGPKASDPTKPVIAYCRIGERSSHTWFVLKYLLGVRT